MGNTKIPFVQFRIYDIFMYSQVYQCSLTYLWTKVSGNYFCRKILSSWATHWVSLQYFFLSHFEPLNDSYNFWGILFLLIYRKFYLVRNHTLQHFLNIWKFLDAEMAHRWKKYEKALRFIFSERGFSLGMQSSTLVSPIAQFLMDTNSTTGNSVPK